MSRRVPTEAEREAAFQRHLETTVNYFAAVEAAGDTPWFRSEDKLARLGLSGLSDIEARRALFMRRFQRPKPVNA